MPDLPWFVDAAIVWLVLGFGAAFAASRLMHPSEPDEVPVEPRPPSHPFAEWDFDRDAV